MKIGRFVHFIDNLKRRGLLSRDPVWIDGIYNGEIAAFTEVAHDSQGGIKIAIDSDDFCSVNESLQ